MLAVTDWLSRFVGHLQSLEIQREKGKKHWKKEKLSTHEPFIGPTETDRSCTLRQ